jgi:hypothetical protein
MNGEPTETGGEPTETRTLSGGQRARRRGPGDICVKTFDVSTFYHFDGRSLRWRQNVKTSSHFLRKHKREAVHFLNTGAMYRPIFNQCRELQCASTSCNENREIFPA